MQGQALYVVACGVKKKLYSVNSILGSHLLIMLQMSVVFLVILNLGDQIKQYTFLFMCNRINEWLATKLWLSTNHRVHSNIQLPRLCKIWIHPKNNRQENNENSEKKGKKLKVNNLEQAHYIGFSLARVRCQISIVFKI